MLRRSIQPSAPEAERVVAADQDLAPWYSRAFFPISYRQFQPQLEAALPHARVARLNPSVSELLDKQSLQAAPPMAWSVTNKRQPHV